MVVCVFFIYYCCVNLQWFIVISSRWCLFVSAMSLSHCREIECCDTYCGVVAVRHSQPESLFKTEDLVFLPSHFISRGKGSRQNCLCVHFDRHTTNKRNEGALIGCVDAWQPIHVLVVSALLNESKPHMDCQTHISKFICKLNYGSMFVSFIKKVEAPH